jgi:hypothetical protein
MLWLLLVGAPLLHFGCGTLSVDHTPMGMPDSGNLLDADTSTMARSIGQWSPWYSTQIDRATDSGFGGSTSLRVTVEGQDWGVGGNWPGSTTGPGAHLASFWSRAPTAVDLAPGLTLSWLNSAGQELQVDTLNASTLTPQWQPTSQTFQAPAGTVSVALAFTGTTGTPQETFELDDIFVGPP